jgi:CubicO group peptidase (beta-lactamase class C family)
MFLMATRVLLACFLLAGCTASGTPAPAGAAPSSTGAADEWATGPTPLVSPGTVGMNENLTSHLDQLLGSALDAGVTPGAVLAVGRHGKLVHLKAYGRVDPDPASSAATPRTIYDLASLTKVVGTTTAAMILEEEGLLDLDRPIRDYLPEFDSPEKAVITSRMLLTHEAGFEAFAALYHEFRGRDQYLAQINARPLRWAPGTRTEYSDWDLILMQLVVERISGSTLDSFLQQRVFGPLGMVDTGFNPPVEVRARVAPTEIQEFRGGKVHGEVHDENAWAIGGVAGHAGLFSTAPDLAIFAQMMLNGGEIGGRRVLRAETISRWTSRQASGSTRALGWDTPSPRGSAGRYFSARSFGHTGFTGTSIWMDPEKGLYVALLTNRVNPTRENTGIATVRSAIADAVQQAVTDVPLRGREPATD